jgi:hypothetical protein
MVKCENSCLNNSVSGYLRNAKAAATVNKDADAPIFKAAHYGAAGDLLQFLPASLLICAKGDVKSPVDH